MIQLCIACYCYHQDASMKPKCTWNATTPSQALIQELHKLQIRNQVKYGSVLAATNWDDLNTPKPPHDC